jgi:hypothetical protein
MHGIENLFIWACKNNKPELTAALAKTGMYQSYCANYLHWACFKGHSKAAEYLIDHSKCNINEIAGTKTALDYAMEANHIDIVIMLIEKGIKFDIRDRDISSVFLHIDDEAKAAKLLEKYFGHTKVDMKSIIDSKLTSMNYIAPYAITQSKFPRLHNQNTLGFAKHAYFYTGTVIDGIEDKSYKEVVAKQKSWWTERENLKELEVKIEKIGTIKTAASVRPRSIYEINVYHKGMGITIGSIGNFIFHLEKQLLAFPELTDVNLIESILQRMLQKRRLLHRTLPLTPKINLTMYNPSLIDDVKLDLPSAMSKISSDTESLPRYLEILINIQSAVDKERFLPPAILKNMPLNTYSKGIRRTRSRRENCKSFEEGWILE